MTTTFREIRQELNPLADKFIHCDHRARAIGFDVVEYLVPVGHGQPGPFELHPSAPSARRSAETLRLAK